MKINIGFRHELDVPEIIVHEWQKRKDQYPEIEEFISEHIDEYLPDEGKLVDKDIAIFLCDFVSRHSPYGGGYFVYDEFSFKDRRNKYTILAFGWVSEDGKTDMHMVGYKE